MIPTLFRFCSRENSTVAAHFEAKSDDGSRIVIPPMVFYEIKRGLLALNATRKMQEFEELFDVLGIREISYSVLDRATHIYAFLRKIGRIVSDADIIIAAFCLVHDCILVTNNTKDFASIEGLSLEDWTK